MYCPVAPSSPALSAPSTPRKLHTSASDTTLRPVFDTKRGKSTHQLIDVMVLNKRISEGFNSSGKSVIVDCTLKTANTKKQVHAKAKIFHMRDRDRALHEYDMMGILHEADSSKFVRPYGLLDGSREQIESDYTEDDDRLFSSVCIVMESGVANMLEYCSQRKDMLQSEKLHIVQQLLGIVTAARKCGVVLLDFKLSNVIRVSNGKYDYDLKAIDFENSRLEGEEVPAETTAAYSSPEVAQMILARGRGEESFLPASHKMDIMALGLVVFELANDMKSFWKSQARPITSDASILEALAGLEDEEVNKTIENTFRGDQYGPLSRWLKHALSAHQNSRASCDELLHSHSLFGTKDRTLDQHSLLNQINKGMERVIVNVDSNTNTIKNILAAMALQMDVIHAAQVDVTFVVRQAALDSRTNHLELKASLSSLGAGFSRDFAGLERIKVRIIELFL